MPLLKAKFYVVKSLPLISSLGKISRKVSFAPFVKMAAERLSGIGPESLAQFDVDDKGPGGLAHDTIHSVERALLSKQNSSELDSLMLMHLPGFFDALRPTLNTPVEMFAWIQHLVTQITSRSIYGPLNPLQDRDIEDAFW